VVRPEDESSSAWNACVLLPWQSRIGITGTGFWRQLRLPNRWHGFERRWHSKRCGTEAGIAAPSARLMVRGISRVSGALTVRPSAERAEWWPSCTLPVRCSDACNRGRAHGG